MRGAAINGLAVVGFVALIVLGMGLAVYSARFVPAAVSGLASAGVYFSSIFTPVDDAGLEVVPSEIPFGETPASEIPVAAATSTPATETPVQTSPVTPVVPSAGPSTSTTYPVGGGITPSSNQNLYGEADLIVAITAVGYMETADTDSFKEAREVPDGERGAFKFTVTNIGTNRSGSWRFEADVPTSPNYIFRSPSQASLAPGERIEFTLGFDRPRSGDDREIEITVDSGRDVDESNESNNDDSAQIDIE